MNRIKNALITRGSNFINSLRLHEDLFPVRDVSLSVFEVLVRTSITYYDSDTLLRLVRYDLKKYNESSLPLLKDIFQFGLDTNNNNIVSSCFDYLNSFNILTKNYYVPNALEGKDDLLVGNTNKKNINLKPKTYSSPHNINTNNFVSSYTTLKLKEEIITTDLLHSIMKHFIKEHSHMNAKQLLTFMLNNNYKIREELFLELINFFNMSHYLIFDYFDMISLIISTNNFYLLKYIDINKNEFSKLVKDKDNINYFNKYYKNNFITLLLNYNKINKDDFIWSANLILLISKTFIFPFDNLNYIQIVRELLRNDFNNQYKTQILNIAVDTVVDDYNQTKANRFEKFNEINYEKSTASYEAVSSSKEDNVKKLNEEFEKINKKNEKLDQKTLVQFIDLIKANKNSMNLTDYISLMFKISSNNLTKSFFTPKIIASSLYFTPWNYMIEEYDPNFKQENLKKLTNTEYFYTKFLQNCIELKTNLKQSFSVSPPPGFIGYMLREICLNLNFNYYINFNQRELIDNYYQLNISLSKLNMNNINKLNLTEVNENNLDNYQIPKHKIEIPKNSLLSNIMANYKKLIQNENFLVSSLISSLITSLNSPELGSKILLPYNLNNLINLLNELPEEHLEHIYLKLLTSIPNNAALKLYLLSFILNREIKLERILPETYNNFLLFNDYNALLEVILLSLKHYGYQQDKEEQPRQVILFLEKVFLDLINGKMNSIDSSFRIFSVLYSLSLPFFDQFSLETLLEILKLENSFKFKAEIFQKSFVAILNKLYNQDQFMPNVIPNLDSFDSIKEEEEEFYENNIIKSGEDKFLDKNNSIILTKNYKEKNIRYFSCYIAAQLIFHQYSISMFEFQSNPFNNYRHFLKSANINNSSQPYYSNITLSTLEDKLLKSSQNLIQYYNNHIENKIYESTVFSNRQGLSSCSVNQIIPMTSINDIIKNLSSSSTSFESRKKVYYACHDCLDYLIKYNNEAPKAGGYSSLGSAPTSSSSLISNRSLWLFERPEGIEYLNTINEIVLLINQQLIHKDQHIPSTVSLHLLLKSLRIKQP